MLQTLTLKKTATAAVTAIALGATVLAASATAADAGKRRHHYHHHGGGAAAAAGVLGFATGLALGAGAYGPYYGSPVVVEPDCYVQRVRRYNRWGELVIVSREICR